MPAVKKRARALRDPVYSAYVGRSDVVFAAIARLHLPAGAEVLDATYGRGVWWKRIPSTRYALRKLDLKSGDDVLTREFPHESMDAVCVDPPFLRGSLSTYRSLERFRVNYGLNTSVRQSHDNLLRFYGAVASRAYRWLKRGGVLIVKCQDEIADGRPRPTHVELLNRFVDVGYRFRDLFVQVQKSCPRIPARNRLQHHARKNHSFYIVLVKPIRNRRPTPMRW